mmetsp:Transcript_43976/g.92523  ORF Transcript_43976/g.92523 Transcript_43976/m.92523 type:complete len:131 (-) Transcript_43976:724-1116(-)
MIEVPRHHATGIMVANMGEATGSTMHHTSFVRVVPIPSPLSSKDLELHYNGIINERPVDHSRKRASGRSSVGRVLHCKALEAKDGRGDEAKPMACTSCYVVSGGERGPRCRRRWTTSPRRAQNGGWLQLQ